MIYKLKINNTDNELNYKEFKKIIRTFCKLSSLKKTEEGEIVCVIPKI